MATNVDAKLLKTTKFPPEFSQKVDMKKINVEVMKKWIASKISDILGNEDDIVIELCFNLLEGSRFPDIKVLQIQLTGFLDKQTASFCKELWLLCLSAQSNPQGVPKELLEAKKLELIQEKVGSWMTGLEARSQASHRFKLRKLLRRLNIGKNKSDKGRHKLNLLDCMSAARVEVEAEEGVVGTAMTFLGALQGTQGHLLLGGVVHEGETIIEPLRDGTLTLIFLVTVGGDGLPLHTQKTRCLLAHGHHPDEDTEMIHLRAAAATHQAGHQHRLPGGREETDPGGLQDVVKVEIDLRYLQTLPAHHHLDPAVEGAPP